MTTITLDPNNKHSLNINLDIEDYYQIINSLKDSCGCVDCLHLVNNLQESLSTARTKVGA